MAMANTDEFDHDLVLTLTAEARQIVAPSGAPTASKTSFLDGWTSSLRKGTSNDDEEASDPFATDARARSLRLLEEGAYVPSRTKLSEKSREAIDCAARHLAAGRLVGIPTETVYGLAADARNDSAMQSIYKAKRRPSDNPLIVHVSSLRMLEEYLANKPPPPPPLPNSKVTGTEADTDADSATASQRHQDQHQASPAALWPPVYNDLMARFWPGPMTLVFRSASGASVAARMPAHAGALALIERCGFPLAAPSANISGRPSPTRAEHVVEELGGAVAVVLDGGRSAEGLESTVVTALTAPPAVLRPGTLTLESLRSVPGLEDIVEASDCAGAPLAPGTKYMHYRPRATVVAVHHEASMRDAVEAHLSGLRDEGGEATNVTTMGRVGVLLTTTPSTKQQAATREWLLVQRDVVVFDASGERAASHLFDGIRHLDRQERVQKILVEGVVGAGVGRAVMNRVSKAASDFFGFASQGDAT